MHYGVIDIHGKGILPESRRCNEFLALLAISDVLSRSRVMPYAVLSVTASSVTVVMMKQNSQIRFKGWTVSVSLWAWSSSCVVERLHVYSLPIEMPSKDYFDSKLHRLVAPPNPIKAP